MKKVVINETHKIFTPSLGRFIVKATVEYHTDAIDAKDAQGKFIMQVLNHINLESYGSKLNCEQDEDGAVILKTTELPF